MEGGRQGREGRGEEGEEGEQGGGTPRGRSGSGGRVVVRHQRRGGEGEGHPRPASACSPAEEKGRSQAGDGDE